MASQSLETIGDAVLVLCEHLPLADAGRLACASRFFRERVPKPTAAAAAWDHALRVCGGVAVTGYRGATKPLPSHLLLEGPAGAEAAALLQRTATLEHVHLCEVGTFASMVNYDWIFDRGEGPILEESYVSLLVSGVSVQPLSGGTSSEHVLLLDQEWCHECTVGALSLYRRDADRERCTLLAHIGHQASEFDEFVVNNEALAEMRRALGCDALDAKELLTTLVVAAGHPALGEPEHRQLSEERYRMSSFLLHIHEGVDEASKLSQPLLQRLHMFTAGVMELTDDSSKQALPESDVRWLNLDLSNTGPLVDNFLHSGDVQYEARQAIGRAWQAAFERRFEAEFGRAPLISIEHQSCDEPAGAAGAEAGLSDDPFIASDDPCKAHGRPTRVFFQMVQVGGAFLCLDAGRSIVADPTKYDAYVALEAIRAQRMPERHPRIECSPIFYDNYEPGEEKDSFDVRSCWVVD